MTELKLKESGWLDFDQFLLPDKVDHTTGD